MTAGTFLQVEGEGDAGSPLATVPKALPLDGITRPGGASAVAVGPAATGVAPPTSWGLFDPDGLRISASLPDDGGHFSHR